MRFRLLVAVVVAFAMLVPAASAQDPPPNSVFRSGDVKQKGKQSTYCWDGTCADYIPTPPKKAVTAETGHRARIRIKYADKPDDLSLTYWRHLDQYGRPTGTSNELAFDLKARKVGGETIAWDAIFNLPKRPGHVYTQAFGFWSNPDGDSSWMFHWKLID